MIISATGKITEDFYMVGTPAMPVYLLDGENPALFDAGLAFLGRIYAAAIRDILGRRQPRYCFLSHSHFDHCGAVSYFKKTFARLQVVAAEKAKTVLGRPNAIELIGSLTRAAEPMVKTIGIELTEFDRFEPFGVDLTLKEGDTVSISDNLTVEVFETPGHTWDCLSFYISQKKILLPSESAGIPDQNGYIASEWLVDYDRYYASLLRLQDLDVDVLCLGHLRVYTGEDAKRYLQDSLDHCRRFLKLIETCLAECNGDVQKAVKRIKHIEYDSRQGPKQIEAAYLLNLEARVKAVKKRMEIN